MWFPPAVGRDASMRAAPRRGRAALATGALAGASLVVAYRRVLGITQRPSWPPPADAVTSAGAEAATTRFVARDGRRPHDAALDFAWSTAASIEPWVEGANFFPRIFADVEAAQSSVHILMFGWREGEVGMKMAALLETEAGRGCRGAGDRRRVRLQALPAGAGDVHRPCRGGRADRRQRRASRSTGTASSRTAAPRPTAGRGRARRPSQALRDRRGRRVDGRSRHRGPLRERRVPRPDGSCHRRGRATGPGRVPDELPRPRRPAAGRARPVLPRAGRPGFDADRARAGDPRRVRRRVAGDPRADRPGAPAARRDERRT